MSAFKLVEGNSRIEMHENYAPIVSIYADASCLRNGSPDASAGCGAVILDLNRMDLRLTGKYLGNATNQQAEILACTKALEELRRPCRVEIFSDSRYVIDTMNGRNRMKTNRSFWENLVKQSYGHHITWRWVKGHCGVTFQEISDRLARAAATIQTNLLRDDLAILEDYLSRDSNQLNIRFFEIELEKIVSRYRAIGEVSVPFPRVDGIAAYPSAFSA